MTNFRRSNFPESPVADPLRLWQETLNEFRRLKDQLAKLTLADILELPGNAAVFLNGTGAFSTPAGGAGGATGTATLDFGASPADEASVVVADAGVAAGSHLRAWFMREATVSNGVDEHEEAASLCPLNCGSIVPGVSFTVRAHALAALAVGQFSIHWERA